MDWKIIHWIKIILFSLIGLSKLNWLRHPCLSNWKFIFFNWISLLQWFANFCEMKITDLSTLQWRVTYVTSLDPLKYLEYLLMLHLKIIKILGSRQGQRCREYLETLEVYDASRKMLVVGDTAEIPVTSINPSFIGMLFLKC